ncbi:MAG: DUF3099 domain-containing protein [Candidatus Nanopelagicales bacterium]
MAPEVYTITATNRALSNEQAGRTRKYLMSMGIRTGCVLAAIVVPGWSKWIFIAGAVVLPYLAVVIANAGRENDAPGAMGVVPVALPTAASAQESHRRNFRSLEQ